MASYASPPIVSAYTRHLHVNQQPNRLSSPKTAALDEIETSFAAWWDPDAATNASSLPTPYRKQVYDATKWRNAELLLEEDGADFLGDDPFATPAPSAKMGSRRNSKGTSNSIRKSAVMNSARKASARRSTLTDRQARLSNISHQRDLTLADLTPRSRRLSKTLHLRADHSPSASPKGPKPSKLPKSIKATKSTKSTQSPRPSQPKRPSSRFEGRSSYASHASLKWSANGPAFGFDFTPQPHAELSRVEEVFEPVKFDSREQISRIATPVVRRPSTRISNTGAKQTSTSNSSKANGPLGDAFNENSPFLTSTPFEQRRARDESRRVSKGKSRRRSGSFPVVLDSPIRYSPAPPSPEPQPEIQHIPDPLFELEPAIQLEADSEPNSPLLTSSPKIALERRKSGIVREERSLRQEPQVVDAANRNKAEVDADVHEDENDDNLHNSIPGAFDFVPSKPLDLSVRMLEPLMVSPAKPRPRKSRPSQASHISQVQELYTSETYEAPLASARNAENGSRTFEPIPIESQDAQDVNSVEEHRTHQTQPHHAPTSRRTSAAVPADINIRDTRESSYPLFSSHPPSPKPKEHEAPPAPAADTSLGLGLGYGFASKLAAYGDALVGLLNASTSAPPKPADPDLRLSELTPRKLHPKAKAKGKPKVSGVVPQTQKIRTVKPLVQAAAPIPTQLLRLHKKDRIGVNVEPKGAEKEKGRERAPGPGSPAKQVGNVKQAAGRTERQGHTKEAPKLLPAAVITAPRKVGGVGRTQLVDEDNLPQARETASPKRVIRASPRKTTTVQSSVQEPVQPGQLSHLPTANKGSLLPKPDKALVEKDKLPLKPILKKRPLEIASPSKTRDRERDKERDKPVKRKRLDGEITTTNKTVNSKTNANAKPVTTMIHPMTKSAVTKDNMTAITGRMVVGEVERGRLPFPAAIGGTASAPTRSGNRRQDGENLENQENLDQPGQAQRGRTLASKFSQGDEGGELRKVREIEPEKKAEKKSKARSKSKSGGRESPERSANQPLVHPLQLLQVQAQAQPQPRSQSAVHVVHANNRHEEAPHSIFISGLPSGSESHLGSQPIQPTQPISRANSHPTSRSRPAARSTSRSGERSMDLDEDVFGAVMENSLEVPASATMTITSNTRNPQYERGFENLENVENYNVDDVFTRNIASEDQRVTKAQPTTNPLVEQNEMEVVEVPETHLRVLQPSTQHNSPVQSRKGGKPSQPLQPSKVSQVSSDIRFNYDVGHEGETEPEPEPEHEHEHPNGGDQPVLEKPKRHFSEKFATAHVIDAPKENPFNYRPTVLTRGFEVIPPRQNFPTENIITQVVEEESRDDYSFAVMEASRKAKEARVVRDECRLTIPVSPKLTRAHREMEKEKAAQAAFEKERLERLERLERMERERRERALQAERRGVPPVAAALLAKLARIKQELNSTYDGIQTGKGAPSQEFTFCSDLRLTLGTEGAITAEQQHKLQFEARRSLWEQRSLEASQESAAGAEYSRSRSQSRTRSTGTNNATSTFPSNYRPAPDFPAIHAALAREKAAGRKDPVPLRPFDAPTSHTTRRALDRERRRTERMSRA